MRGPARVAAQRERQAAEVAGQFECHQQSALRAPLQCQARRRRSSVWCMQASAYRCLPGARRKVRNRCATAGSHKRGAPPRIRCNGDDEITGVLLNCLAGGVHLEFEFFSGALDVSLVKSRGSFRYILDEDKRAASRSFANRRTRRRRKFRNIDLFLG